MITSPFSFELAGIFDVNTDIRSGLDFKVFAEGFFDFFIVCWEFVRNYELGLAFSFVVFRPRPWWDSMPTLRSEEGAYCSSMLLDKLS